MSHEPNLVSYSPSTRTTENLIRNIVTPLENNKEISSKTLCLNDPVSHTGINPEFKGLSKGLSHTVKDGSDGYKLSHNGPVTVVTYNRNKV